MPVTRTKCHLCYDLLLALSLHPQALDAVLGDGVGGAGAAHADSGHARLHSGMPRVQSARPGPRFRAGKLRLSEPSLAWAPFSWW